MKFLQESKEYVDISDEEVLQISLEKPRYFEELVNRYQEPFIKRARYILGDKEEVHDIVQDTFTKIYINANSFSFNEGGNIRAWMYRILTNTCYSYYQKLKKDAERKISIDSEMLESLYGKDELQMHESSFFEKELLVLLSQLPRKFSKILRMHYIDEMPQKDIAKMEGLTLSAVKTRIYRGKNVLKKIAFKSQII
tara:strand:+ start:5410 stop:5997 length:588 start_codon:yes stop_codon:yes gene_type:complete